MWIIISIVVVVLMAMAFRRGSAIDATRSRELLVSLKPYEPEFKMALEEFEQLERSDWYVSDRQYRQWKAKYQHLGDKCTVPLTKVGNTDPFEHLAANFIDRFSNGRVRIDIHNDTFIRREAPTVQKVLASNGIAHNEDQVNAIASDEDNTLLAAGAGTGKTTTILGKLAYLIERVSVRPDEILLLSFTGRAVEELKERIAKKFSDKKIEVWTFHSFGLSIIGKVLGQRPDLAFENSAERQTWLDRQFDVQLKEPVYLHRAIEYFAYYLKPVVLTPGFQSLDDYYKYAKTEQNLTLQKELLKSQQEVMIANFLYMNGVRYQYEHPYQFQTADKDYKQYKPDFFLPDYGIYIEHFGVDRDGGTHFTSNESQNEAQSKKYQAGMAWKRELHAQNKTTLVETFSYEFAEGTWKEKLTEKLRAHGVKFSPRDLGEVLDSLKKNGSVKEITQLLGTFLDLAKSNGYDSEKLQSIVLARKNQRELAFLEIFAPLYRAYQEYLHQHQAIDFHDMLIKAAQFVTEGPYQANFKYIIIDEFQDFSASRCMLVKALCDQNPEIKLFCVGDDWQSIFRFTGSDISLMTNFETSFGFTRKNQLVLTNRFGNGLAEISNRFILKNPNQIRKEVRSGRLDTEEPLEIRHLKTRKDMDTVLHDILSSLNRSAAGRREPASVFLLGRYKHNRPDHFLGYRRTYRNLSLEYLTIHAAKGAEADYVIILDVVSGKYGLPSEVTDDPLLEIVLCKGDSYPHAEERRLMYVALTRARRKAFIITEQGKPSCFVLELDSAKGGDTSKTTCRECGGEMVERRSSFGAFLGCENFPDCTYTIRGRQSRRSARDLTRSNA